MKKPVIVFIIGDKESTFRGKHATLFKNLNNLNSEIHILQVNQDNFSMEQAIFNMASELPIPEIIVVQDTESEIYSARELNERNHYHFAESKIVLLTNKHENYSKKSFELDENLQFIIQETQSKYLSTLIETTNPNELNIAILTNDVAKTETKSEKLIDQFLKIKLNTPVAPASLPVEETANGIFSRKRNPGKVLIFIPSQKNVYGVEIKPAYPTLGVLYIAAMLEKAGHSVSVVDQDADKMAYEDIIKEISELKYDIIGISSTTPTFPIATEFAQMVRKAFPKTPIIYGGIHATVDPEASMKNTPFDYLTVGEAECTIVDLVDAIMAKENDFSKIKGILYRDSNGTIITTTPRELAPDLDDYPFPALHLLRNINVYAPPDATFIPVFSMMVSRGCPGQCTYCQTKNIFGRRTRYRSPQNVVDEIRLLVEKYGAKEIHFMDDVITANKKFVFEFCKLLKKEPYKLKLEVPNGLRADMVNEEILTALKDVGLENVGYGVETGNVEIAKLVRKGIHKNKTMEAVKLAKKLGLKTWCFFILGLPGDTTETIRETIKFAIQLNPKFAKFLILKPFPGSEIYYQLDEKGLIDSRAYAQYGIYTPPVHHLEELTAEQILKLQKEAFRKFYFRPGKVFEHLIQIDSWEKFLAVLRGFYFIAMNVFKKNKISPKVNLASGGTETL